MKIRNKFLTLTLGLALAAVGLASCGGSGKHTVEFYKGTTLLKSEEVQHGKYCPEYTPAEIEGYEFKGWYEDRSHSGNPFDFETTKINEDIDLFAWYKELFIEETRSFFLVGSAEGLDWNGKGGDAVVESTVMTLNRDLLATEHNVFEIEWTFKENNKFRIIPSTDGLVSDGWTDDYGYGMIKELINSDPESDVVLAKGTNVKEQDSMNIGIFVSGRYKITLDLQDTTTPSGGITLELLEELDFGQVVVENISLVGTINNWGATPDIELVSTDEGVTWEVTYTLAVDAEFKVRLNHAWDVSWGFAQVVSAPEGAFIVSDGEGGNIKVVIAGTYLIHFVYATGAITITAA